MQQMTKTKSLIIEHEGYRNKLYRCTAGRLTIGIGCNIEVNGLCNDAIISQFEHDYRLASFDARRLLSDTAWSLLGEARQAVIISMVFQLGYAGVRRFKRTLGLIETGHYDKASDEMLASRWARQTPARAHKLSEMMLTGVFLDN